MSCALWHGTSVPNVRVEAHSDHHRNDPYTVHLEGFAEALQYSWPSWNLESTSFTS